MLKPSIPTSDNSCQLVVGQVQDLQPRDLSKLVRDSSIEKGCGKAAVSPVVGAAPTLVEGFRSADC